ncbi:hypothetical protein TL16_g12574 [Triparma laevis f. inornata]|uniref:Protein ENHANCED DISEASE RESISTANCE 2 C-terminal domain-containing protein n=1 Tax=Triparma laevis f. inornata TaxID=1714386 RepID=A0A9W7BRI7_9STRA|nr:hypothetical protein TL16_g12574 [Triparma laevis f. inornata]
MKGFVFYAVDARGVSRTYHCCSDVDLLPMFISMSDRLTAARGQSNETVTASVYNYKVKRVRLHLSITYKIHVTVSGGGRWGVERAWEELEKLVAGVGDGVETETLAECKGEIELGNKSVKHGMPDVKCRIRNFNGVLAALCQGGGASVVRKFLEPKEGEGTRAAPPARPDRRMSIIDFVKGEEEWVDLGDKVDLMALLNEFAGDLWMEMTVAVLLVAVGYYDCAFGWLAGTVLTRHRVTDKEQKRHAVEDETRRKKNSILGASPPKPPKLRDMASSGSNISDSSGVLDSDGNLSSPLPLWPASSSNCWSEPEGSLFKVRGENYFKDKIKIPSGPSAFPCRGVDLWLTDNAMSHIARHPSMLGGRFREEKTFVVNFLMPWGNLVSYYKMPEGGPEGGPEGELGKVWDKFVKGDQKYRDARLKILPVVVEGPWICQKAIGPGNAPAVIGKALPVNYYVTDNYFEPDQLPENVLAAFRLHNLDPDKCPVLPPFEEEEKEGRGSDHEE